MKAIRLILRLPKWALLPKDIIGNSNFYFPDSNYFSSAATFAQKNGLPVDKARTVNLISILSDAAQKVKTATQTVLYRSVFEGNIDFLNSVVSRSITTCQGMLAQHANPFNYIEIELVDPSLLSVYQSVIDRIGDSEFLLYQPLPTCNSSSSGSPVGNYLVDMGIEDTWHNFQGGKGDHAHCVILESCFKSYVANSGNVDLPEILQKKRLPASNVDNSLIDGVVNCGDHLHSEKTLGILAASHTKALHPNGSRISQPDCKGIVPNVFIDKLVCIHIEQKRSDKSLMIIRRPEIGLLKAIFYSQRGSILLIEDGRTGPVEMEDALFWLIKCATHCLHITVIEPAGNISNRELTYQPADDSGAVIVGACNNAFENTFCFSPFLIRQSRFCFAPVPVSAIESNRPSTEAYKYGATSAAAAIIAGVACQLQSVYRTRYPDDYLKPDRLRAYLCNPEFGQRVSVPGVSGSIPNTKTILANPNFWPS